MDKLVHQAGLTHPGLADRGHHLAVSLASVLQGLVQRGDFRVAPHKPGEPTRHSGL